MGRSNCSLLEFDHTIPPRQGQGSVPEACNSQSVPAAPGGRLAADVTSQGQRQKARRVLEASRRCVWSRGRRFAASSVPGSMAADYPRHPHASDRTTPRPWLGPALAIEHASISVALPADKRDASTSYHSWFLGGVGMSAIAIASGMLLALWAGSSSLCSGWAD